MRVFRLAKNVLTRLRSQGLRYTARYARKQLSESYNEWRLGVRTMGKIDPAELGIKDPFCHYYYPSDYESIYRALRHLDLRPNQDVFLDYGSGMGRVVVVAATFPFRKVIGLEISPDLNEVANKNLRCARSKLKCHDVELVAADAATYQVPSDVNYIFIYNPFHGPILSSALVNIRDSLLRAPRRLFIVFKHIGHLETVLEEHRWLVKKYEFQSSEFNYPRESNRRVLIFEGRV